MSIQTAVKQFIDIVNGVGSPPDRSTVSSATAIKFLFARKFDVPRAVALFEQHEIIRQREELHSFDPMSGPLHAELETGKFTILPSRDASGAAIALFTANLHLPMTVTHKTTLQGVVYQLDVALQNADTQKAGLVFIYDMSSSKYSNFDYDLSQKILTLLKGGYPARLKKVLIVTAPLWFKAPFKILRLFVREKLRERVFTVSVPQLSLHIPRDSLPTRLGGSLDIDHSTWLLYCHKSMTNREDELLANIGQPLGTAHNINNIALLPTTLTTIGTATTAATTCTGSGATTPTTGSDSPTDGSDFLIDNHQQLVICENKTIAGTKSQTTIGTGTGTGTAATNGINTSSSTITATGTNTTATTTIVTNTSTTTTTSGGGVGDDQDVELPVLNELWSENPPSSASSGFSDDDSLAGAEGDPKTIEQIVQMVKERGRHGLVQDYADIKARAPDGTFTHARMRDNLIKNRYTDVLCYDHSRVVLSQENDDPSSDYINANFVDGYKQKNAYISTQGPLPKTASDFWRMVWEQHCLVIVMTTRVMERGRIKCGQYWETVEGGIADYGCYRARTLAVDSNDDYTVASLELTNTKTEETRNVSHWQFTSWPDYGVPSSAMAMIKFLQRVRDQQSQMVKALGDMWAGHPRGPPIVVHCSAGIGRTGTFITLDICISRLEDVGTADIRGTVERIRSQRAYSIQMPDQYVFCHLALIEYALDEGMLKSADLTGFDDREDESD